jgi:hypothetical protein
MISVHQGTFDQVSTIIPLVGDQLINLTIHDTINAQVPYLLRSVLPNGLLSLRSLGIEQRASNNSREVLWPGSRWRENVDGTFREVSKRKAPTTVDVAYITSLARGAPNLEELELQGECQLPIVRICSPWFACPDSANPRHQPFPCSQTSDASTCLRITPWLTRLFPQKSFATSHLVAPA